MNFDPSKFAGGDADSGVAKLVTAAGRAWFIDGGLEWDSEQDCYERGLFTVREYLRHGYNGNLQTDTGLTLGEIARLFEQTETYPRLKRDAAHYKDEADGMWQRICEAKNKIRDTSVDYKQRQSAALLHLGIRNSKRRGADCERIAGRYHTLRMGDFISFKHDEVKELGSRLLRVDTDRSHGVLVNNDPHRRFFKIKPHSHDEAVAVIQAVYKLEWRSFLELCRLEGVSHLIQPKADCYPRK